MEFSLRQIEEIFNSTPYPMLGKVCESFRNDERAGVQKLIARYERKLTLYKAELSRLDKMMFYERKYANYAYICGIDEAGRGPLAGPVVAAAVILPKEHPILYVNDSKQLSEKRREELFDVIQKEALSIGVGIVSEQRIDEINILQATYEAMRIAVSKLSVTPDISLNDAVTIPDLGGVNSGIRQVPIIKGDAKSLSIASASIIAKVTRDRIMKELDFAYPGYGFSSHKGYGSESHMAALREKGPSPCHRKTFLKNILGV